MGLLDNFDDPMTQGLLSAGLTGLQASGPSFRPTGAGQILGAAGNAGLNQMNEQKLMRLKQLQLQHAARVKYGLSPVVDENGNYHRLGDDGSSEMLSFKSKAPTQFVPGSMTAPPMVVNLRDNTFAPVTQAGGQGQPQGYADNSNLTGEEFLKTLPEKTQGVVKGMLDGRVELPASAFRSKDGMELMAAAQQVDPTFDQTTYKTRLATRKDFTSGKSAQSITAFNTVLGHMETLANNSDALKNSDYPLWNKVANTYVSSQGDDRVQNFTTAKKAVIGELVKAFNGHVSEGQLKEWEETIDASNSPAQLKAATKTLTELLGSKINALGEQYSNGMGKPVDGISLLNSKSQESYNKILGKEPATPKAETNSNSKFVNFNGKQVMATKAPDGFFYVQENGSTYKVKD